MNLEKLNKYRFRQGEWATKDSDKFGLFFIPTKPGKPSLMVICAPMVKPMGQWQHVSVSLPNRTPTWLEMCKVKDLFWGEDETVVQFHPKKTNYVNIHKYCLHMWKKVGDEYEVPPEILV